MRSAAVATVYRDMLFLLLLGFMAMLLWLLPFIADAARTADDATHPPGNVIVAISWPPGDTDVDLWVYGPGEVRPVGYSNKSGVLFNLLRDDLGTTPDNTPLNYENAYTRGIAAGEYVIDVHCFRCPDAPVPVDVEVSVNTGEGGKGGARDIATTHLVLDRDAQEKTALRFRLDARGAVLHDSMNNVYRPLRDYRQWQQSVRP